MSEISVAAKLACIDIYDPISPNSFIRVFRVGETVCGTQLVDKKLYIVCQGTENLDGWKADFDIEWVDHPVLGKLHKGFNQNIDDLIKVLLPTIPYKYEVIVCGHSKGAGEAAILGAKLKLAGVNVVQEILFACPNAGDKKFATWLSKNIKGISFRNAPLGAIVFGDPVPLVPLFPFHNPYPHTMIDVCTSKIANIICVTWHNAKFYYSGALLFDLGRKTT